MTAEVLELESGPTSLGTPGTCGLLEKALRVVLHDQQDASELWSNLMEGDGPVDLSLLALGSPHDAPVRYLLGDRRLPAAVGPEDLRPPVELLVGLLLDAFHLLHVGGEVFELGPLVVDNPNGSADLDRLDDVAHLDLF